MVTNVKSLLETVKTVEDEAARGTRALESSIDAISHEMKVSSSLFITHYCFERFFPIHAVTVTWLSFLGACADM